VKPKIMILFF